MNTSEFNYIFFTNVSSANDKLGELAVNVARENFDVYYSTILFYNATLYAGIEVFLRSYIYNTIIVKGFFNAKIANQSRQFVLFTSDISELEIILYEMEQYNMDNNGKFIIICQSQILIECDENDFVELCWKQKIVNVVFIRPEAKEAVGYTYYPTANGICNNFKAIKLTNKYDSTSYGKFYGFKLKNFNLCPLRVSTFIQAPNMNITNGIPKGSDGDLLRILAHGLNATLEVMTPQRGDGWGYKEQNGTWMGSLADLIDGSANFSMTSAAITLTRFSDFQISSSYYTARVAWVCHPPQPQNVALKLLHPFGSDTRIALIISFLLVVLCAFVIKIESWSPICGRLHLMQPTKSIVFYSWLICMGQGLIKLPSRTAFLQIILVWVWYTCLIRTVYQVYLISSLKGKFYESQFDSIEEAMSTAHYPFGGGAALKDYYIDSPAVYDKWININTPDILPTTHKISKGMKFVLAMSEDTAKIVIKKNHVNLRILPQTIVTSPTVIFFKKYSPMADAVNLMLHRLSAAGFPAKLRQIYTVVKLVEKQNGDEQEELKIVHFTACYALLILGWLLSIVFFFLEIYFGRFYRHPTQCSIN